MDSTALLDSALFQLTPTRTRFDLVLFCGSKSEKLASGLFEPFISHLKFARDQSSRGGYSISLRPPTSHSSWFTKSTFERFVRFVNTPAILERFVGLEKEISQIEHSIQANEIANGIGPEELQDGTKTGINSNIRKSNEISKLQKEFEESNEGAGEENSKIQLQRLLETRRTLLRREQAMAYARGVAAGFEVDGMDDLISFANAFGASRLREACNNYKELWKKKHGDGLWMAELAAVKACVPPDMSLLGSSGIILSNEVTALSLNGTDAATYNSGSDTKDDKSGNSDQVPMAVPAFQAPMGWPNHMPQYFYPFQQPPPFQGYPYPPMQPHQTMGDMTWPPKAKSYKKKGSEDFEGDESSESSESDSASDDDSASSLEDQGKRHSRSGGKDYRKSAKNRKKASKTVIIRNINYITPDGRNEEIEDNELPPDNVSIKDTVDAAVGALVKEKKAEARQGSGDDIIEERRSNGNWDAFQNILMNHDEESVDESANLRSVVVGEENFTRRSSIFGAEPEDLQVKGGNVAVDSSMVTRRSVESGGGVAFEHFVNEEGTRRLPRTMDSAHEFMLLPKRSEMLGNGSKDVNYTSGAEKSVMKPGNGEDWFVADNAGKTRGYEGTAFDESCILASEGSCNARAEQSRKQELVDDSFMVQSSLAGDDLYDSRWRPDLSIAADLALASNGHADTQKEKRGTGDLCEPNDLFMILERSHEAADDSLATDHGIDFSVVETNARLSAIGTGQEEDKSREKNNNNAAKNADARAKPRIPGKTLPKSRAEAVSKTAKKPTVASRTMAQKSKFEKEEEMRKRIEDHLKERQKRIAERTAMAGSRRASLNSATSKGSAAIARAPVKARAT